MNNKVAVTLQRWEIAEKGNRIGSELNSEKMIYFHYKTTSTLSMWVNKKNGFPFYYEYRGQRLRESIKGEKAKIGHLFVSLFFCNLIAGFLMCMPHTFFLSFWNFLSFYKISFAVERYESIHIFTRNLLFFLRIVPQKSHCLLFPNLTLPNCQIASSVCWQSNSWSNREPMLWLMTNERCTCFFHFMFIVI